MGHPNLTNHFSSFSAIEKLWPPKFGAFSAFSRGGGSQTWHPIKNVLLVGIETLVRSQIDVEFHGDFISFWFQKPISHRSKVMDTQLLVAKRQCKQRHNNLGHACPNQSARTNRQKGTLVWNLVKNVAATLEFKGAEHNAAWAIGEQSEWTLTET